MFTDILTKLNFSTNEAKIYETLLEIGQSTIGVIATTANINRRNVYDSMDRLIEKGFVFEIRQTRETIYKPVDPKKLQELIKEKETALQSVMPKMLTLYQSKPHNNDVYVYKGIEGWKNYMRDILRVGQDVYTIGGIGAWTDEKISSFLTQFQNDAESKEITFHILFNQIIKDSDHPILKLKGVNKRFLSKESTPPAIIETFGDHTVFFSNMDGAEITDNTMITVVVNEAVAESIKVWFKALWKTATK